MPNPDRYLRLALHAVAALGVALTAAGLWTLVRAGLDWDDGEEY